MKPAGDELRPIGGGEATAGYPPPEQLIDVRRVDRPDAVVVDVDGAVDVLTAPRLRTVLVAALDSPGERPVVVDLTRVRFFGSPGLQVLAESAREASTRAGFQPLRLAVDSNRPVLRPIELTGFDAILALYSDVEEAVRGTSPG
ncbi:anti-sigma factor antagonist [Pseudonocardia zijingensis]|jgi:anti-sigma B factor antagonist|uniref:Anti-sigma factor antagonist n=1 Tax=Pseudonocardia zijingensis TaxID=153376 RepID=A0ABN1PPN1_9PSEU